MITALILANIVYIFTQLITNYGERYFYPSFVLIYAASGIAISIIFNEIKNNVNEKVLKNIAGIIVCTLIFILLITNATFLTDHFQMEHKALTPYSNDNYTVACVDAGAITYYSK